MQNGYKLLVLFDPHIQTMPDNKGGWIPWTAPALDTAIEFGRYWKPDECIIGHDFMEFAPISYWNRRRKLSMEGRRLSHDFEYANQILDKICAFTKSKIVFQPGNHDYWMDSYIEEKPELEGLINQDKMLGLKERGIIHLRPFSIYKIGKASFTHAFLRKRSNTTKYHSARMAEDYGSSMFYGHFHTCQVFTRVSYDKKPNTAVAIGCLSSLNPGWMRNNPTNFINQLLFMEFDNKGHFSWYAPVLIDAKFQYNGKVFGGK